jgi:Flp pilus assembly protein TadG
MGRKTIGCTVAPKCSSLEKLSHLWSDYRGQAAVEFTLVFILLLIVAWIPADFGLALYTGQIAQNASREGARIAAADPTLVSGTTSCNMPACYTAGNVFNETAARLPAALLQSTSITLSLDADTGSCNRMVTVSVSGTYNYFFYQILRLMRFTTPTATAINRSTAMRWEHQTPCL